MRKSKAAAWIKYRLARRGTSSAEIARELKPGAPRYKTTVSNGIQGKRTSRPIMEKVAAVLGLEFEQV